MRNLLLMGLIPLLLMACTSEGKYSTFNTFDTEEECGDAGTWVKVHYGDSQLRVKPKVHLKKGSASQLEVRTSRSKVLVSPETGIKIDNNKI